MRYIIALEPWHHASPPHSRKPDPSIATAHRSLLFRLTSFRNKKSHFHSARHQIAWLLAHKLEHDNSCPAEERAAFVAPDPSVTGGKRVRGTAAGKSKSSISLEVQPLLIPNPGPLPRPLRSLPSAPIQRLLFSTPICAAIALHAFFSGISPLDEGSV